VSHDEAELHLIRQLLHGVSGDDTAPMGPRRNGCAYKMASLARVGLLLFSFSPRFIESLPNPTERGKEEEEGLTTIPPSPSDISFSSTFPSRPFYPSQNRVFSCVLLAQGSRFWGERPSGALRMQLASR
jgi:hypothetical protein